MTRLVGYDVYQCPKCLSNSIRPKIGTFHMSVNTCIKRSEGAVHCPTCNQKLALCDFVKKKSIDREIRFDVTSPRYWYLTKLIRKFDQNYGYRKYCVFAFYNLLK